MTPTNHSTLKDRWHNFQTENPKVRIRDAAAKLNVSEAELIATSANDNVTRLQPRFEEILKDIKHLGRVLAITRNDHCVHERHGEYTKMAFKTHVGLAVNPEIDLRLFMSHWHFGFAVNEKGRFSLQFFDEDGQAVHKIYLTEKSN